MATVKNVRKSEFYRMVYAGSLQGHLKFHYRITKISYFVRIPLPPHVASKTFFGNNFHGNIYATDLDI